MKLRRQRQLPVRCARCGSRRSPTLLQLREQRQLRQQRLRVGVAAHAILRQPHIINTNDSEPVLLPPMHSHLSPCRTAGSNCLAQLLVEHALLNREGVPDSVSDLRESQIEPGRSARLCVGLALRLDRIGKEYSTLWRAAQPACDVCTSV